MNSPLLRPRLPTFRTRSSSIGLFREQALSTKDLEDKLKVDDFQKILVQKMLYFLKGSFELACMGFLQVYLWETKEALKNLLKTSCTANKSSGSTTKSLQFTNT